LLAEADGLGVGDALVTETGRALSSIACTVEVDIPIRTAAAVAVATTPLATATR
jgi:hypothetical protein